MAGFLGGGVKQKSDSGRGQACIKFQHDGGLPNFNLLYLLSISESPITTLSDPRDDHALSRARYSWPGSNYPVMLDDCRAGPPPSAASAAEASLPDPRSARASFLSGVCPLPGSRPRLSMYAAPGMGPFSGAYAAGFVSLAEKRSLKKNLGSFCCHKDTSFCMTCNQ